MNITKFIDHNYRHFNASALKLAAQGYKTHIEKGGEMLVTLAGAMSTAELGLTLAEMIRQGKVHAISCTGANLEEDIFNLVAHDHYELIPNYRDLTPADEQVLLEKHLNRVTDTCIPEGEAIRRIEKVVFEDGKVLVYLKTPLEASALNRFLFEKNICLNHLVKRKNSLEAQFLELTKNK